MSTPKAKRAMWYAYPLGRQAILCVSKRANSAPEWICHNFFLKLLRQHPRFPWTEKKKDHYLTNTIADLIKHNLYGTSCSCVYPLFFYKNFSVRPQRARVLHNKIAPSLRLRPSPETLQSYYSQARSSVPPKDSIIEFITRNLHPLAIADFRSSKRNGPWTPTRGS